MNDPKVRVSQDRMEVLICSRYRWENPGSRLTCEHCGEDLTAVERIDKEAAYHREVDRNENHLPRL